jgi:hypothetical protein
MRGDYDSAGEVVVGALKGAVWCAADRLRNRL